MEMLSEKTGSVNILIESTINIENDDKIKSKYEGIYKATPSFEDKQEERRNRYLSQLKLRRNREIDDKRGIYEVFNDIDMSSEESDVHEKKVERGSRRKTRKYYAHRIMFSEWFHSIPTDLESKWYFKICPKGKRELVVANECITTAYNKTGIVQAQFESMLPGGSKRTGCNKFTILDCIFNFQTNKYFVLDIIAWNSYTYTDLTTDCRIFFLKSKLEELHDRKPLKLRFFEVPTYRYEMPNLEYALSTPMQEIDGKEVSCDGILFYHADGVYRAETTPLVLWLKPYMIPELFEIPVHESHLRCRPKTYENFTKFIMELQDKKNRTKMEEEPLHEYTDQDVELIRGDEKFELHDITEETIDNAVYN